jgi:hypothetical protein
MKGNISIGDFIHRVKAELVAAQNSSGTPFDAIALPEAVDQTAPDPTPSRLEAVTVKEKSKGGGGGAAGGLFGRTGPVYDKI